MAADIGKARSIKTMGKIHELPAVLANQIAAGEVIERPASVVKELTENALDAQSTRVDIIVEDAGLSTIQVIDNGVGIEADDLQIAFQRHATSKITSRDDLFRVRTLGFRGEALPSIASIADVNLKTVSYGAKIGSMIHFKGGKLIDQQPFAGHQGTSITVSHLFYNTPARLKYLKSPQTELAAITDWVNHLAMSHPEVAFSLSNNGRILLKTSGNGDLIRVISSIYGIKSAQQMIPFGEEDHDFEVNGLVSLPKLTRASKNYISLLLNGRYIKNSELTKAVIKGYGSKLMVGRYPVAVVSVKLDPLLVDVNVHPTKQEVRISKEDQLIELITRSIANQIEKQNLIPNAINNLTSHRKTAMKVEQFDIGIDHQAVQHQHQVEKQQAVIAALLGDKKLPSKVEGSDQRKQFCPQTFRHPIKIFNKEDLNGSEINQWDQRYQNYFSDNNSSSKCQINENSIENQQLEEEARRFPDLKYIGQLHGTYLLAESSDGFYLLDQHAAQERVKYEFYRQEIGNNNLTEQKLLVPIILTYSVSDALKIEQKRDKLAELGIHLEDFGPNTYILHEHPSWIPKGQEEETIRKLIDECLMNPSLTVAKFRENTAIMISCKQSIKANHHLERVQAVSLLKQLKKCSNPFNCPHGRPTIIKFSNQDLEKMFKRIQDSHQSLRETKNTGE